MKTDLTRSQKQDIRALSKLSYSDAPVPLAARLSVVQLSEIEEMSAQGMTLAQIGEAMRYERAIWEALIELNPQVAEAFYAGIGRYRRELTAALRKRALVDGDTGAIKFALEKVGGEQWAPPKVAQVVVQAPAPLTVDISGSVNSLFERQRKLLESSVVEGEYEEADPTKDQPG